MSAFLMTVSFGRYFIRAFSTRLVNVISSTMASALACFSSLGLINSVTRCLLFVVIFEVFQLIVLLANTLLMLLYFKMKNMTDNFKLYF